MKPLLPLIGALFLAGCGKSLTVQVRYPGLENMAEAHRQAMSHPLLLIRIKNARADLLVGHRGSDQRKPNALASRIDGAALGEAALAQWIKNGLKAPAFEIEDSTQNAAFFAQRLGASGILEIVLEPVPLETSTTEITDKQGIKTVTIKAKARLAGKRRALSSSGAPLGNFKNFSVGIEGVIKEEADMERWFRKEKNRLWQEAAQRIAAPLEAGGDFGPQTKQRVAWPVKGHPLMEQGFEAAKGGNWDEASKKWNEAVKRDNHPMAHHNLGVWHEFQGRFSEALKEYRLAKATLDSGRTPMRGAWILRAGWDQFIAELERFAADAAAPSGTAAPSARAGSCAWFDCRIAVLPFANQSNFVDAAQLLRQAAHNQLARQDYAMAELDNLDRALRQIGISDGGQLGAVTVADVRKAAGADLLLYGDIFIFNELPLGVYHKREVGLSLKLVDAASGETLWQSSQKVLHENAAKGDDAEARAFLQIAKSLYERLKKFPMKEESVMLARWSLSLLPSRSKP